MAKKRYIKSKFNNLFISSYHGIPQNNSSQKVTLIEEPLLFKHVLDNAEFQPDLHKKFIE